MTIELGFKMRQVQLACARNHESSLPRKGRSPKFNTEQAELKAYRHSPETLQMNFLELAMGPFSYWGCSE